MIIKKLVLVGMIAFLASCGDPRKNEFVRACGGGHSLLEEKCECAYDKLESDLGNPDEWMSKLRNGNDDIFFKSLEKAILACGGGR